MSKEFATIHREKFLFNSYMKHIAHIVTNFKLFTLYNYGIYKVIFIY